MVNFVPRLDILPTPQQRLWTELTDVPSEFVLYGGTALALHLGHRESIDFDFFGDQTFDPEELILRVPFMADAQITQRGPSTLTGTVDRDGAVKISFFGVPNIRRLRPPHEVAETGLKVASLLDLAGTKASVVQARAEARDYIDIDALIRAGKIDLSTALAAGQAIYGPQFNPEITLKALSFFDDGNLRHLPDEMKSRLAAAARQVDLDRLPNLNDRASQPERDLGSEQAKGGSDESDTAQS
jgi:nucleotidyltransferase AbiEii toxin of type IV toxin-antitoxin system